MDNKAKKLKAAIMGVIHFLQQEEKERNNNSHNTWSRSGRETIMHNRLAVQSRSFGLRWQKR